MLSTNCFANDDLLKELTNYVADNLGPIYPELERNIKLVRAIINKSSRRKSFKCILVIRFFEELL